MDRSSDSAQAIERPKPGLSIRLVYARFDKILGQLLNRK